MASSDAMHDYYGMLGVAQTADNASIRESYKRLAKSMHPDKNPGNPHATSQFQLLQAAYSKLINPAERKDYDAKYAAFIQKRSGNKRQFTDIEPEEETEPENKKPRRAPSTEPDSIVELKQIAARIQGDIEKLEADIQLLNLGSWEHEEFTVRIQSIRKTLDVVREMLEMETSGDMTSESGREAG